MDATAVRNNKTRSLNIRAIFGLEPDLCGLADSLGLKLFWRASALWAGDVQLTYPQIKEDGVVRDADQFEQAEIAMKILRRIERARKKWGTLLERAESTIDGFVKDVVEPNRIRQMHFSVYRNDSLDECWTFGGSHIHKGGDEVALRLVGQEQIRATGKSLVDATKNLRAAARKKYGSMK